MAGLARVFLAKLAAGRERRCVLNEMQRLTKLEAVVAHALRERKQHVEDADDDCDRRRDVRSGQKSRLAAVQLDTAREILGRETIEILIVANALLDRKFFRVRNRVSDRGAEI